MSRAMGGDIRSFFKPKATGAKPFPDFLSPSAGKLKSQLLVVTLCRHKARISGRNRAGSTTCQKEQNQRWRGCFWQQGHALPFTKQSSWQDQGADSTIARVRIDVGLPLYRDTCHVQLDGTYQLALSTWPRPGGSIWWQWQGAGVSGLSSQEQRPEAANCAGQR